MSVSATCQLPRSTIPDIDPNNISNICKENVVLKNRKIHYYSPRFGYPRMNWKNYHRLNVIYAFLDDLEFNYPSICTVGVIGRSVEGRDIKILKISNSDANNVGVWMDAGIHSREWISPAVATYIANDFVKNFDNQPEYVKNKDWYILPVLNPDGYEYTHTQDRMWRKNRSWYGGECVGVDLNRNFSVGWGERGSSELPNHAFFKGPEPFSEPESAAVRDVIVNSDTPFKVYLTFHSYGRVIIFPFGFSDELCPDYVRLLEGATTMSKAIFECTGNTYKVGISKDVMYYAAGTSTDWSYAAAQIPFCYLVELSSKTHKFLTPKDEIQQTCKEILSAVKALMEFIDKRYVVNPIPCKQYLNSIANKSFKVATQNFKRQVWEVKFNREGQRHIVKSLDTAGVINIWKEEQSTMDIMVDGPTAGQVAGLLHDKEIPFSVAIGDVTLMMEKENAAYSSKKSKKYNKSQHSSLKRNSMDWHSYHRLDVIYGFMDNLAKDHPYLCSVSIIGQSVEGRDIKMLKISNCNPDNVAVWLDASIHPREWISTAVVTYIANHLVKYYHEHPESVTNKDWHIVPVLNPDGYEYTHTHDRMWRKNRARYGECVGVDLNRNFSYGWGEKGEEGSSEDPGNIFFRGPKPFSEPETQAVKNTILESDTTFKVFLSFHSYGEVVIFPWGYTSNPCPDYVELLEGGTAMAKAIYEKSGRTYRVGSTKDLMYYASGTSIDWAYAIAEIPYTYMVELRGKSHRFLLPKEDIIDTSNESLNGIIRLMEFVDKPSVSANAHVDITS